MNNFRYIQYSRKSSEPKERQIVSIPDQNRECDQCSLQNDLNVVCRLEESKSAFKPHERPEFDKMIDLIRTGKVDAILTWKPDRLCRNPEEGGIVLQLLQDKVLKEIRTALGEIYTPDSDHLVLQIHFGMANQFSRNLSQNVKRGQKYKCERGEYPRKALIGYEGYGETGIRNIRPHKFEAPLIKEVFELAATGNYSLGRLVGHLHKGGLKTKKGKRIGKSHLHAILTCSTYYGYFYWNGELHQGSYEPLIAKGLFDAVQKAIKDRSKPKTTSWVNPYSALIKCKVCGCAITQTVKNKFYKQTERSATYSYQHCTHKRGKCDQSPITTNKLEELILEQIEKITIDEEVWKLGIKLLKAKHNYEAKENISRMSTFQQRYRELTEKLNHLIDMRADEELTPEEFQPQKERILKDQADVKSLMSDNEVSSHNWLELVENFLNTAFYARELIIDGLPEVKRNLIMAIGENLLLEDEKLYFSFKKPFDILLKPQSRSNVLREMESNHH